MLGFIHSEELCVEMCEIIITSQYVTNKTNSRHDALLSL